MKTIAVVMDPIQVINVKKDTTFVIIEEALRRDLEVYYCTIQDLGVRDRKAWGKFRQIKTIKQLPGRPAELGPVENRILDSFDVIWMRKDPPVDMDFIYSTHLLDLTSPQTWVINSPAALRSFNEKLFCFQFPDVTPKTMLSNNMQQLIEFYHQLGDDMIIKPLDGMGGKNVFRLKPGDKNMKGLLELMTDENKQYVLAQQFLPEIKLGDKRIIVVDGEPIGATARVPPEDDYRANIHVGGVCVSGPITERDREICAALAPRLRKEGLLFVGLDVIGDYLTEINVTSPTGVREINELDGVCLESVVWDRIQTRFEAGDFQ